MRNAKNKTGFHTKPLRKSPLRNFSLLFLAAPFMFVYILSGLIALAGLFFENRYENKIYPGVLFGEYRVAGMTRDELLSLINEYSKKIEQSGVQFSYREASIQLYPRAVAAEDPDLTYELFSLDVHKTVAAFLKIGRSGDFFDDARTKISLIRNGKSYPLFVSLHDDVIFQALQENFAKNEEPPQDARLKIDANLNITILPEQIGYVPDYAYGLQELRTLLEHAKSNKIVLPIKNAMPKITAESLQAHKDDLERLFAENPTLTLTFDPYQWSIPKEIFKDWIYIQDNRMWFGDGFDKYLSQEIAAHVETPVQEARFQISSAGRVTEFKPNKQGVAIDYEKTRDSVNETFFTVRSATSSRIVTKITEPLYSTESINNLGIKEIIGVGTSDFSGSPPNRIHNISVGVAALNGLLIPPGEEFSLIKALGEVNAQSGYLPELVIKGNRTIPEYGGGLCQIGTTLFRGALNSGLPITERRNHSYRVRYYEPAGTDCTIYSPHPDCKFINDTGSHVLLQTYTTKENKVIFEFWGTKDGRKVTQTQPSIYNITQPPPTKYIETEDLPAGETKCTESAHKGATTQFDYAVEYPDGVVKNETFYSVYRPWQAICLIGVAKDNEKQEVPQNTSNDPDASE